MRLSFSTFSCINALNIIQNSSNVHIIICTILFPFFHLFGVCYVVHFHIGLENILPKDILPLFSFKRTKFLKLSTKYTTTTACVQKGIRIKLLSVSWCFKLMDQITSCPAKG